MGAAAGLTLPSHTVGALPLVNHLLGRLRFAELLARHLPPPDPRTPLAPLAPLGVLTRNLVLARVPLYGLGEWARGWVPALLGLEPAQVAWLHDDRLGRALDRLFDADRQALLTALVVQMVKAFSGLAHAAPQRLDHPHRAWRLRGGDREARPGPADPGHHLWPSQGSPAGPPAAARDPDRECRRRRPRALHGDRREHGGPHDP